MSTDKKKIIEFSGGHKSPIRGGLHLTFDALFSDSDELFQSKVMCANLVWID